MSFLDEIAARLVAQGVGVINTSIFTGGFASVPSGPGPFISIIETGGFGPTRIQNIPGAATQRPSAQVVVRAADYPTARAKAKLAYLALDGVFNTSVGGTVYQSIVAKQEPYDLGLDDLKRPRVAFNIDTEKQPS